MLRLRKSAGQLQARATEPAIMTQLRDLCAATTRQTKAAGGAPWLQQGGFVGTRATVIASACTGLASVVSRDDVQLQLGLVEEPERRLHTAQNELRDAALKAAAQVQRGGAVAVNRDTAAKLSPALHAVVAERDQARRSFLAHLRDFSEQHHGQLGTRLEYLERYLALLREHAHPKPLAS